MEWSVLTWIFQDAPVTHSPWKTPTLQRANDPAQLLETLAFLFGGFYAIQVRKINLIPQIIIYSLSSCHVSGIETSPEVIEMKCKFFFQKAHRIIWPYCLIFVLIYLIIFPLPEKKDNKCGHIVMGATSQMRIHLKIIIAYIYGTKALWDSYYNFPNFIIEETKV